MGAFWKEVFRGAPWTPLTLVDEVVLSASQFNNTIQKQVFQKLSEAASTSIILSRSIEILSKEMFYELFELHDKNDNNTLLHLI